MQNQEDQSGNIKTDKKTSYINIFSYCIEGAFFWVRFSTLYSHLSKKYNINFSKVGKDLVIKNGSVLLFNRFQYSFYYKTLNKILVKLKIPYIFDIDDLYWDLPQNSIDMAGSSSVYRDFIDKMILNASVITTTNEFLKSKLEARFKPRKANIIVKVIPNCVPNWDIPRIQNVDKRSGVLIANSDVFKLTGEDSHGKNYQWFSELLIKLFKNNIPVQFLGGNNGALPIDDELKFYFLENCGYQRYLEVLNSRNFEYGLIPVGNSEYADAKSEIKIQEFLHAGMKVFASKILPYTNFIDNNQIFAERLTIVDNSKEEWERCVKEIIQNGNKEPNLEGFYNQRLEQSKAWEDVLFTLSNLEYKSSKFNYFIVSLFNVFYLGYLTRTKNYIIDLILPLRKLIRNQD